MFSGSALPAKKSIPRPDDLPAPEKYCQIGENSKTLLEQAIDKLASPPRYTRILKIARTIADLESVEDIATHHISEAIQYRSRTGPCFDGKTFQSMGVPIPRGGDR